MDSIPRYIHGFVVDFGQGVYAVSGVGVTADIVLTIEGDLTNAIHFIELLLVAISNFLLHGLQPFIILFMLFLYLFIELEYLFLLEIEPLEKVFIVKHAPVHVGHVLADFVADVRFFL